MTINIDNDNTQVTEGVWTPPHEGVEFLVSHWSSIPFQRAVQRHQAPYRRKIDAGKIDPKIARDVMARAMAEALIHDWRGDIVDAEGKKVQYDSDAGYKLLVNNPDVRDFISEFCMDMDHYKGEVKEEAEKS